MEIANIHNQDTDLSKSYIILVSSKTSKSSKYKFWINKCIGFIYMFIYTFTHDIHIHIYNIHIIYINIYIFPEVGKNNN